MFQAHRDFDSPHHQLWGEAKREYRFYVIFMIQPRGRGFQPHRKTYVIHGLVNPNDESCFQAGVSNDAQAMFENKGLKDPFVIAVEVSNPKKQAAVNTPTKRRRWVFRWFHQHKEKVMEDCLEELSNCDDEDARLDAVKGAIVYEERAAKRQIMTNSQFDKLCERTR